MRERTLASAIASAVGAYQNSALRKDAEWLARHLDAIERLSAGLPSGSGIDRGTQVNLARSSRNKLVLTFSFHHMTEHGYYDGWTDHTCVVTPAFDGLDLVITGPRLRRDDGLYNYVHETFDVSLSVKQDWGAMAYKGDK